MASEDKFEPSPVADVNSLPELLQFMIQENQRIAQAINQVRIQSQGGQLGAIQELHAEPKKKTDWMLVAADGSDWDPGEGRGLYYWLNNRWNLIASQEVVPPPVVPPTPPPTGPVLTIEGFGSVTTGGAGNPVVRVTSLANSGPGTLREALSAGNRVIEFDVGGIITLSSDLTFAGNNVTVNGLSAPAPGITINGFALSISGRSNIIVKGLRVRNTVDDAFRIFNSTKVVLDHCSAGEATDGAIDITQNSSEVTVQWCILAGRGQAGFLQLLSYESYKVSLHHNLYINGDDRSPHISRSDTLLSLPIDVMADVVNNLMWNYRYYATRVRRFGTANVVKNYYGTTKGTAPENTMNVIEGSSAYVDGNYSHNNLDLNRFGTRQTPFAVTPVTTTDAITAANHVYANAGARGANFGLDAYDQALMSSISGLATPPSPSEPPQPQPGPSEAPVWSHDFEDPTIWTVTTDNRYGPYFIQARQPTRVSRINTVARDGQWATRLFTAGGDTGISGSGSWERCDLRLSQEYTDGYKGREYWWAHSVFFPSDFDFPPDRGLVFDFHHTGSTGSAPFNTAVQRQSGVLKWRLDNYGGSPGANRHGVWLDEIQKNIWYDWVYRIKWDDGAAGITQAWLRIDNAVQYTKVLDYTGPNMFAGQGVYLKLANYHSTNGIGSAVIHDRIRCGVTPYSVAMVTLEGVAP